MLKEIMGHHTCFGSSESNLKRTPDRKAPSEPLGIPARGGGSAARKGQSLLHPPFPHSNTSALYHSGHSAKQTSLSWSFLDQLHQNNMEFHYLVASTILQTPATAAPLWRCPNTYLKNTINYTWWIAEVHKKAINLITVENWCGLTWNLSYH